MHIKDLYRDEPALDLNSRLLDIPVFKPQWHLELTSFLGLAVLINACFGYYQSYPAVCKSVESISASQASNVAQYIASNQGHLKRLTRRQLAVGS